MKDIFLLDVDDTLLDFAKGERAQIASTLAHFGIAPTPRMAQRFHEINDGLWKRLERGELTRERLLTLRFELFFEEFGLRGDAAAFNALYFEGLSSRAYLIDGAAAFLRTLRQRGRLFTVTNGSAYIQRRRTALAGIDGFFEEMFISETVGCNKPSPAYAAYVASHIEGFSRERAVWMGDSLTSDRLCAAAMGVDFILFGRERPAGYDGLFADGYPAALGLIGGL